MILSDFRGGLCPEERCACAAALKKIWVPLFGQAEAGLSTEYTWSPEQYKTVLNSLLSSEHHAMPVTVISRKLGDDGKQIVRAMVKANLLSYRPWSGKFLAWSCQYQCRATKLRDQRCMRYLLQISKAFLSPHKCMCQTLLMAISWSSCDSPNPSTM